MSADVDVAVVGAGMAGLTAAHELSRVGLDVRVFEATSRVGGRMASFRHAGYTIDEGAEQLSIRGYRATWELLRRVGLPTTEVPAIGKAIGVWRDGRAHPGVADGPLAGGGLSARARVDLARLLRSVRPSDFDADHPEDTPLGTATVAEFARRYHPDLHDYLFQPVAGSFFGWSTARSTAAPMVALMAEVGPVSSWRTYRDGMDTLARRIAERVDVETGASVGEVIADGRTARLRLGNRTVTARSVLLCVPAPVAAELHANPTDEESDFVGASTFTPALKVSCLLDRPVAPPSRKPMYALLTPEIEEDVLSGILVDHEKHPCRAPVGCGLLSLMAAPQAIPELLDAPDSEVVRRLVAAARRYVPGLDVANRENFVHRFRHAHPEATPETMNSRRKFLARPVRTVDHAGDWVMVRPSSEGAVRAAALAVSRVLSRLGSPQPRKEAV